MSMRNTTAEENQEELTLESRQAYFGGNGYNGNGNALSNPMMYSSVANQRLMNVQNGINSNSWMNNGGGNGYYSDQALSKRRFSNNMGRYANMGLGETDYPTGIRGLGNAGGATGTSDDLNGLNGALTSTGTDQTQSQDYIDTYNTYAGNSFPSGSGIRQNVMGGGGQNANLAGGGNLNNNLLVGSRRPFVANRRNGLGYGVGGLGAGAAAGLTGYPSAYGQGANQGIGQLQPVAGIRSSGYGGGSGYGGRIPIR